MVVSPRNNRPYSGGGKKIGRSKSTTKGMMTTKTNNPVSLFSSTTKKVDGRSTLQSHYNGSSSTIPLTQSRSFGRDILSSRLLHHHQRGLGGIQHHQHQHQNPRDGNNQHHHQTMSRGGGGNGGGGGGNTNNPSAGPHFFIPGNNKTNKSGSRQEGGVGGTNNKQHQPHRNWLGLMVTSKNDPNQRPKTPTTTRVTKTNTMTTKTKTVLPRTRRPQTPNHKMSAGRDFTDRLLRTVSPGKKRGRSSLDSSNMTGRVNDKRGGIGSSFQQKSAETSLTPLHQLNDRIARIERTLFETDKRHIHQPQDHPDGDDDDGDALYRSNHQSRSRSRSNDRKKNNRRRELHGRNRSRSKSQERLHQKRDDDDDGYETDEGGGMGRFLNPNATYHHPTYRSRGPATTSTNDGRDVSLPTLFAHTKRLVEEEAATWPGSKSYSDDANLLHASTSYSQEQPPTVTPRAGATRRSGTAERPLAASDRGNDRDGKESRHQSQQVKQNDAKGVEGEGRDQSPVLVEATPMPIPVRASLGSNAIAQNTMAEVVVVPKLDPSDQQQQSLPQASTPKMSNVMLEKLADGTQRQRMLDPVEKFRHPHRDADKDDDPIDRTSYEYFHHGLGDINLILSDLSSSTSGVIMNPRSTTFGSTEGPVGEPLAKGHLSSPTSAYAGPTMACMMFPSVVQSTCDVHNDLPAVAGSTTNGGTTFDSSIPHVPAEVHAGRIAAGTPNLLDNDDERSVIEKEEPSALIDALPPTQSSQIPISSRNVSNSLGGSRTSSTQQSKAKQLLRHDSPMASSLLDRADDRYWMYTDTSDTFDMAARQRLQSKDPILETDEPGIKRTIIMQNETTQNESEKQKRGACWKDEQQQDEPEKSASFRSRSSILNSGGNNGGRDPERVPARRTSSRSITSQTTPDNNVSTHKTPTPVVEQHRPREPSIPQRNLAVTPRSKSAPRSRSKSPTPAMAVGVGRSSEAERLLIQAAEHQLKTIQENRRRGGNQQQGKWYQRDSVTPVDGQPPIVKKNEGARNSKTENNLVPLVEVMQGQPIQQHRQDQPDIPPKPLFSQKIDLVQRRHVIDDAKMDIRHLINKPLSNGKIEDYKLSPYHPKGLTNKPSNSNKHQPAHWGWLGRKKTMEDPILGLKDGVSFEIAGSSVESGITSDGGVSSDVGFTLIFGGKQPNRRDSDLTTPPRREQYKEEYNSYEDREEEPATNVSTVTRESSTTTSTVGGSSVAQVNLKHATTFDDIIQDLQRFESQLPNAEFAVVELGEDGDTVPAHSFLMNKEAVEHKLMGGSNENDKDTANSPYGLRPISEHKAESYEASSMGMFHHQAKAIDDSGIEKLKPSLSFTNKIDHLKQIQESLKRETRTIRRSTLRKQ